MHVDLKSYMHLAYHYLAYHYLVPTHCINGVTTTAMDIIGVIFAFICTKGAMTRQAIYVGNNIKGLFLLVKAFQGFGCIPNTIPNLNPPP